MSEKTEFERAYCLLLATLATLDSLDLSIPAAHTCQAIDAMERADEAVGVDFAALRRQASQSGAALH
jgi:hypothetical protein